MKLSVRGACACACVSQKVGKRDHARARPQTEENHTIKTKTKVHVHTNKRKSPEMKTFRLFTMMREVNALGHHSPPSFFWVVAVVGRKVGASWCAEIWFQLPLSIPSTPPPLCCRGHHRFVYTHSACRKGRVGGGRAGDGWYDGCGELGENQLGPGCA